MTNIEIKRQNLQEKLDSQKGQLSRNILGQYSTPYTLALEIIRTIKPYINNEKFSFLEPAVGTGVFFSALIECFDSDNITATGYEIDPHYYNPTKELWKDYNIEFVCQDFLKQEPFKKFDLLVTNPPYSRHHHINQTDKVLFQKKVFDETGIKISGLAGLYCYFLMLSAKWLKNGGVSVWLIPSEFMNTKYGQAIKEYLTTKVDLKSIHRFLPEDLQFSDALVTSSIVIFKNQPPSDKTVLFTSGGKLNAPSKVVKINRNKLNADSKWITFFDDVCCEKNTTSSIGDYFRVSRGLATGDNKFFILGKKQVELYNIPKEFLIPILPSPRMMKHNIIDDITLQEEPFFLFFCEKTEDELKQYYPDVLKYIELGCQNGIDKGYICKHRKIWYCCETKKPAPFYMSYMSRSNLNRASFRFILNNTNAIVTNSYLCLYPLPQYEARLKDNNVRRKVWNCLSQIPFNELVNKGRVYGGGLYKMEPNELLSVSIPEIEDVLSKA